jgi:type IV pilus assembly protein PilQ
MKNSFNFFWGGDRLDMNSTFRQFTMAAVAIAVMQVASAQVTMTHVLPMQIAGQGTEIRVMFNGTPPQPKAYQLNDPARLILDFEQAKQTVGKTSIPVSTDDVSSLDIASDEKRARVTVNLNKIGSYTTRVEGNALILKVNAPTSKVASPISSITSAQPKTDSSTTAQGLSDIDFQRSAAGEGQVVLNLLGVNTPVDVQQQGSRVVVRFLGNKIPAHLIRRLNVNDFATPVSTIDAYNDGANGVITIHSTGSYEYMAFQAENKLTISLKKPEEKQGNQLPMAENRYIGNKISLDFQDIEVRRVLQLLADFTNINMVASDSVGGSITLRLKDVPWDQALDIILKTKNLDKRRNGNVIWIAPVSVLAKAEEEEAKAIAQSIKLAPIQTEYIQLSYAKAADILKLIEDARDSSKNESNRANAGNLALESLLSSRGSAVADVRTNTLIVNDTAQNIDKIRRMIDLLDVSIKQVMIEARIVRAATDFTKEMGVKWGVMGVTNPFKNGDLLIGGSDQTLWDVKTPDDDGTITIERPDNLNVDLGVTNPAGKIAFGLLNMSNFMLDLELSALQSDGYGEVISTPKVLTADKQNAKVASGTQIPYQSSNSSTSGNMAKTEFVDATLSLDVTPSITPEGKILMALNITSDSPGAETPSGQLTISKNSINTNVLVDDGETVVLGGIFEQETRNVTTKVPFLGDLPYLRHLFRKDSKTDSRRELLIFVTPRIVNDSPTRNH